MKHHKKVKIKCLYCGNERFVFYSDIKRGKGKYCNRECWDKHKRKLPEFIICKWCKKKFKNIYSQRTKKFCSKDCYTKWCKGRLAYPNLVGKRGVKPKTYHLKKRPKHGGVKYQEWRMSVWKRDNFTCQDCGKTANELKKINSKIIAHHIKAYSKYPKLRYDIDNGLTLCIECHKKTENYGSKAKKLLDNV